MIKRFFIFTLIICQAAFADSNFWNLPIELNDSNTKIKFELDSTWHVVHGTTSGIKGNISLSNPLDYNTVQASVEIPISLFNTDNSSRDSKMRKVMEADMFPKVQVKIENIKNLCAPLSIIENNSCQAIAQGLISIRNVTKNINIPIIINKKEGNFIISGITDISWAEFGIEDPSILIAHIADTVQIKFEVKL